MYVVGDGDGDSKDSLNIILLRSTCFYNETKVKMIINSVIDDPILEMLLKNIY